MSQRRRLHNLSGRPAQSLNMVTVTTTIIPCISSDFPLLQLVTVAACAFATYLCEASACSVTPLWVAGDCSEIPPPLSPSSKIQFPQPLFIRRMLWPPKPCQRPPSELPPGCQHLSCLSVAKLGIIAYPSLYFWGKGQQTILKLGFKFCTTSSIIPFVRASTLVLLGTQEHRQCQHLDVSCWILNYPSRDFSSWLPNESDLVLFRDNNTDLEM